MTQQLRDAAQRDPLTGVYNRRWFDENLALECKKLRRTGSPISLLVVDIDFFKKFNDSLGHSAGDDCIRAIACSIQDELRRATDAIARYGGEEFVVLLPHTDVLGAAAVANRVLIAVRNRAMPHPTSNIVTTSIGGSTFTPGFSQSDPEELFASADRALYEAKRGGRNRFVHAQHRAETPPSGV